MHRSWFATAVGDERALLDQASVYLNAQSITNDLELTDLLFHTSASAGTNFATAVLYQYLKSHPLHGNLISRIRNTAPTTDAATQLPHMIIVPGMFAAEKPELGGDGALLNHIAERLGFSVSTAPLDGKASLVQNAEALHHYLSARCETNFWLVSVSRGSSDVKVMLHRFPNAPYLERMKQWISVSGIVTGSPLINRLNNNRINSILISSLSRLRGMAPELPGEFDVSHNYWSDNSHAGTFGITHVAPIPLDWHVTKAVLPRYERLKKQGPTDGIIMLNDLLTQPGRIYPIWGADHMLRVPHLSDHFYRLINFLKDDR